MRANSATPASLFIRYLLAGLGLLGSLVFIAKPLLGTSHTSYQFLAGGIFLINLLTVGGFTLAILNAPNLLADDDAPDLAYYLGFSLTVGALAATFLSDIALSAQSADLRSKAITGALAQFGAGLVATLIGLCAKILLSAKQQRSQLSPEEFYRRVRTELGDVSRTIRDSAAEMTTAISESSRAIRSAGQMAEESMTKLAESMDKGAQSIVTNLSAEKISKPISNFSEELARLGSPTSSVRSSLEALETSSRGVTGRLNEASIGLEKTIGVMALVGQRLSGLVKMTEQLSNSVVGLTTSVDSHSAIETLASTALSKTAEQINGVALVAVSLVSALTEIRNLAAESKAPMKDAVLETASSFALLTTELHKIHSSLGVLNAAVTPLEVTLRNFNEAAGQVSMLTNEVSSLVPQLSRLSNTVIPLSESLAGTHAPLGQTKEVLGELQRALAALIDQTKALRDVINMVQAGAVEQTIRASVRG